MTNQEIFTKVVKHLRRQGARSVSDCEGYEQCVYRAPNGFKCAAGCLIADAHYNSVLEGKNVRHLAVQQALEASGVPYSANSLVGRLQTIHDGGSSPDWEAEFTKVARDFNLKVPQ